MRAFVDFATTKLGLGGSFFHISMSWISMHSLEGNSISHEGLWLYSSRVRVFLRLVCRILAQSRSWQRSHSQQLHSNISVETIQPNVPINHWLHAFWWRHAKKFCQCVLLQAKFWARRTMLLNTATAHCSQTQPSVLISADGCHEVLLLPWSF